ncbi:winged-helix domain-containing protein [Halosimplex pelagicum]|uniref:Helix-turn-helix domain-containing protein n=1 Tax=Halosimplex pelagicum TaxID=869886 RepID=A0A7D5TVI5_9EURY|nr:winged-helix domain-containing protein [Halosimplex pelagicum]QLH83234.1 helix-turn-helix domain-containing protein [Halosimplex pelagicum]
MSENARDTGGRYSRKLTEQDLLKVFDYETDAEEPMLAASEIVDALYDRFDIDVSDETVRRRLRSMEDDGTVSSKRFGARAVGWTALVAPRLDPDVAADADELADADRDEYTALNDL